jgi:hypothetical protein
LRGSHAAPVLIAACLALSPAAHAAKKGKEKPRATAAAAPAPARKSQPGARDLIVKYLEAIGGEAAQSVQSRLLLGSVEQLAAAPGSVSRTWKLELAWKGPAKAREVWLDEKGGKTRRTFDGTGDKGGWIVGPDIKKRRLHQRERVELVRLSALFQPATMMPLDEAVVDRRDQLNGHPAVVLKVKSGEQIWLDAATFLPLRLDLLAEHPKQAGEFYYSQVYFEDWKYVGAAQLPHTLRRVLVDQTLTWRFTEVKQGADLPDRLFKKPYFWRG